MAVTELMDGSTLASTALTDVAAEVQAIKERGGRPPCLVTVLIGDDPASATYVNMKRNRCRQVGMDSRLVTLPVGTTTAEAVSVVTDLSNDATVDGILVQHPAPAHVDERAVFEAITPAKDVDGVTYASFASMAFGGRIGFPSCTPAGIMSLLDHYDVHLEGADAVVIGRSPILGNPSGCSCCNGMPP